MTQGETDLLEQFRSCVVPCYLVYDVSRGLRGRSVHVAVCRGWRRWPHNGGAIAGRLLCWTGIPIGRRRGPKGKGRVCHSCCETMRSLVREGPAVFPRGYVYVLREPDSQLVKIGFSVSPERRIRRIQREIKRPLEVLLTLQGTFGTEGMLHSYFGALSRREGPFREATGGSEWFTSGAPILRFVRAAEKARKRAGQHRA